MRDVACSLLKLFVLLDVSERTAPSSRSTDDAKTAAAVDKVLKEAGVRRGLTTVNISNQNKGSQLVRLSVRATFVLDTLTDDEKLEIVHKNDPKFLSFIGCAKKEEWLEAFIASECYIRVVHPYGASYY